MKKEEAGRVNWRERKRDIEEGGEERIGKEKEKKVWRIAEGERITEDMESKRAGMEIE